MNCPIHHQPCKYVKEKLEGCPQSYGREYENKCKLEWLREKALKFFDLANLISDVINTTESPSDPYK